jgi:MFS family permease
MRSLSFTSIEKRAAFSLASIYGLRMFGLFLVLPVLATYAVDYPGYSPFTVGLAIGIYGLTQAIFQIPLGLWSDRIGRKPVIVMGLVIFAFGSWVAGQAETMNQLIIGRALQGCGAIASALMAMAADVSREERRSQMMAVLGLSIGVAFVLSLVSGPILVKQLQLSGLFNLTAILALVAIVAVFTLVPKIQQQLHQRDVLPAAKQLKQIIKDRQLVRLDVGIFCLHFLLSSSFVVLPILLIKSGLAKEDHGWIYLPVMIIGFMGMLPGIIFAEKKKRHSTVMSLALLVLFLSQLTWLFSGNSILLIIGLALFFLGFNLLEAMLPSMISRFAPAAGKGTAMGLYSTSQFLGSFLGGVSAGFLASKFGGSAVFILGTFIISIWGFAHRGQKNPPAVSSISIEMEATKVDKEREAELTQQLLQHPGILEVLTMEKENMLYLRYDTTVLDGKAAKQLVKQIF